MPDAPPAEACWNTIGVRGTATCPLLPQLAHCRNCNTYAIAARRLLDRDLPAADLSDRTGAVSTPLADGAGQTETAFVFRIGEEWLALAGTVVDEVAAPCRVRALPHRRGVVRVGLVSVRGELVLCISLAALLGLEVDEAARDGIGRLVVVRDERGRVAFSVDEAHGSYRFRRTDLKPVPATLARAATAHVAAVLEAVISGRERRIGLLDTVLLLEALNESIA